VLGDVPILGNLFKSKSFQKNETELMFIVTAQLVKPVNRDDLPQMRGIDGLKNGSPLGVEPKGEGINGKTGFSISGRGNDVAPQASDPKKAEKGATPEKKDSNSTTTGEAVGGAKSTKVNGPLPAALAWRTGLVSLAQPVLIP
jgi:pilus assembly protein CpaC